VRGRFGGRGEDPARRSEAVLDLHQVDVGIDEGSCAATIQGDVRLGVNFRERTVGSPVFAADVVRHLEDEVRLAGHLIFLERLQVGLRIHEDHLIFAGPAHEEGHGAALRAHHNAPRQTHSLLVPEHVPAIGQVPERHHGLECDVKETD